MRWTADDEPVAHIELRFDLLAQATRYAKQNRLDYSVQGNHGQSVEIEVRGVGGSPESVLRRGWILGSRMRCHILRNSQINSG
jgi:hypothetical protein